MAAKYRERAREAKKRGASEVEETPTQSPPSQSYGFEQKEMFLPPGLDGPDYATAMVNYQAYLLAQQHMILQSQIAGGGEEAIEQQRQQLAQLQELAQQREQLATLGNTK